MKPVFCIPDELLVALYDSKPTDSKLDTHAQKRYKSMKLLSQCSKRLALLFKKPMARCVGLIKLEAYAMKRKLFMSGLRVFGQTSRCYRIPQRPFFGRVYDAVNLNYTSPYRNWRSPHLQYKCGEMRVSINFFDSPEQGYKVMLKTSNDVANDLRIIVSPRSATTGLVQIGCYLADGFTWRVMGYCNGRFVEALAQLGFEAPLNWYVTPRD